MVGRRIKYIIFSVMIAAAVSACGTTGGKRGFSGGSKAGYTIKKGETLWDVAKRFHIPVEALVKANKMSDPDEVVEGQTVIIPRGKIDDKRRRILDDTYREKNSFFKDKFIWPAEGVVFSSFGIRRGRRHDGIDIAAKKGTIIRASAAGEVVYNGKLRGYGNLVVLRHPDHYYTLYAHNSRNLAKVGEKVKQGENIAEVGATGRASGPHCHFEIRRGQKARNPLFYLPIKTDRQAQLLKQAINGDERASTMGGGKKSKSSRSKKKGASRSKKAVSSGKGINKFTPSAGGKSSPRKIIR